MTDQFLTLQVPSEGYYMDRGSKFLAYAFPVDSESQFTSLLQQVRKDHPKARHFCTAFRLFPDASLERSNDDGEPSGSAGKPILGQIVKKNLTNVMIVVVRYFGGTKLGVPGLIEAYKTSAANALEAGNIITRKVVSHVRLQMNYETFPHFLNYCKQAEIPVSEEIFTEKASLIISFRKSAVKEKLSATLNQFSKMDFKTLDEYAAHLEMNIEFLPGEFIV
ncbi:MAG TPA: YigZ family protein [Saprospiraceae bacterium]|nr:YigZ family protein [Saprospiraceae bacterium]